MLEPHKWLLQAKKLAEGAQNLAATLEESSASMEEVASRNK